jgi:uncharacterized RDD family membrane protein YckC
VPGGPPPPGGVAGPPPGYHPAYGYGPAAYGSGPPPGSGAAYGYGPPGAVPVRPVFLDPVLGLPLAPWWKRFLAILLDGAIIGGAYFVVFVLIGVAVITNSNSPSSSTTTTPAGTAVATVIFVWVFLALPAAFYYGIMNGSRRGQTVGKMALSISVRDARTGMPIGFGRAFGRYWITVLFSILFVVPALLDYLSPLWDGRRQAWHDKVVTSVVVDLNP